MMSELDYMEQLHQTELLILDEIDRVCKKNNIKYCITAGTLLGAVRHGGFIPWDDDADVVMPREEFKRFCSISEKEMSPDFFVDSYYTKKNCFRVFGKVRMKNTLFIQEVVGEPKCALHDEIWIDIFPLDNADLSIQKMEKKKRIIGKLKNILVIKMTKTNSKKYKELLCQIIPTRLVQSLIYLIMSSGPKNSEYYINYGSQYSVKKQTVRKDMYFPSTTIQFEDRVYSAPRKVNEFLNQLYGSNYMELPPIEKRRTHKPLDVCFDVKKRNEETLHEKI